MSTPKKKKKGLLTMARWEQYRTVDELIERSQANSLYYTLLVLSSFIVASGLLLSNSAIVIGGMLVTPLLTPILLVALGLAIGEVRPIKRAFYLIIKSAAIVVVGSAALAFIFGTARGSFVFDDSAQTAVLYFIVAIASGVAATLAWARKEIAEVLPGVAIAVSLVPPLGIVGIALASWDIAVVRFHVLIFLFNLLGILVGSLVVFSLLKFYRSSDEMQKKAHEIEKQS